MTSARALAAMLFWAGTALLVGSTGVRAQMPPAREAGSPAAASDSAINPVATQPLAGLSATRERPLFSPSRRPPAPPPPPVVAQDYFPPAAGPPSLTLYGVVVDRDGAQALVRKTGGKVIRLRVGDDIDGWTVAGIGSRRLALSLEGRSVAYTLFDGATSHTAAITAAAMAEQVSRPAVRPRDHPRRPQ